MVKAVRGASEPFVQGQTELGAKPGHIQMGQRRPCGIALAALTGMLLILPMQMPCRATDARARAGHSLTLIWRADQV